MGRLIDTNIFIAAERGHVDLYEFIAANIEDAFFMSVITASELLHGVHRATAKHKERRSRTIERWITEFPILEIDLGVAREHARLSSELISSGQLIGFHDQWLAAVCLVHDLTIVTANVREFSRVSGLSVENWMTG